MGRERVLGCIASNIGVGLLGPGHVDPDGGGGWSGAHGVPGRGDGR